MVGNDKFLSLFAVRKSVDVKISADYDGLEGVMDGMGACFEADEVGKLLEVVFAGF